MFLLRTLFLTALVFSMSCSLNAQIAMTNSGAMSTEFTGMGPISATVSSFDLMGGNTIVVMLSSESIHDYAVSYDGQPLVEVAHAENAGATGPAAPQDVGIFVLIDPASSTGDISITGDSTTNDTSGLAYSYAALSGVVSFGLFDPEGHSGSNSGDVVLEHETPAGGFVFVNGCNNASELANAPIFVSGLADQEMQRTYLEGGGSGHLHHFGSVSDDGIYEETINLSNSRDCFIVVSLSPNAGSAEVPPDSFEAFRGFFTSGTLEDTFQSDDLYLKYNPGITLFATEFPVWLIFDGTLSSDSPPTLAFKLEAAANTPGLSQSIQMFNWNSGQYDELDLQGASFNNDSVVELDLTATIGDYVETGTGSVRARLGWKATGIILVFPWTVCVDQVVWIE